MAERSIAVAASKPSLAALGIGLAAVYLAGVALATSTGEVKLPAVLVSAPVFGVMQWVCPRTRPNLDMPLCPLNWALLIFFLQLVLLPLSVLVQGPSLGRLLVLPSEFAINMAVLLSTAAYLAFCCGYQFFVSRRENSAGARQGWKPGLPVMAGYAALGLLGFVFTFGSVAGLVEHYTRPASRIALMGEIGGTARGFAGTVLRPFLPFAFIMAWCRWVDRRPRRSGWIAVLAVTLPLMGLVVLAYLSYSYNRGSFTVPLVAMTAVLSRKVRRISPAALAGAAVLLLLPLLALEIYRRADFRLQDVWYSPEVRDVLVEQVRVTDQVQLYGGAPQFLGYLLERWGLEKQLFWGSTLLASALYPVPVLGKSFRSSSGVALYNKWIYGSATNVDQVIPFQGELFLNFQAAGVIGGFLLLGALAAWLERGFEAAGSAFDLYVWHYSAIWALFLINGSLAVVSQIAVFFFWPVYIYAAGRLVWIGR
ncbi:MAG: hypothetical protein HY238_16600 [Acidobacteria bacterium]|nr:hypothetical protein [Acidobacteriota bacterium]